MAKNIEMDLLEQWQNAIESGILYKKKYGDSDNWSTYREYYRGHFPGYSSSTSGILPYNLVYAMARTMIPNIYFRNPYINITPRFKMGSPVKLDIHAKVVEAVDNWLMQEMSMKKEIKTALMDCFFTNRAIWKIGYDSEFGFLPKHTQDDIGLSDTTFTQYSKKGEAIEYNINVKPGMPWVLREDPDDIIVPFGIRTLDESPWIAHRIIRPLDDVKADPKYKNTKDLQGTHLDQIWKDVKRTDFYRELSKHANWVMIYEVRDRKKKEVFAFVPGYEKFIREPEEDILQIEGLPYVDLTFNEDTQYYWGPSDVAIMEPQQLECNEARTQAMLHRRISLVKFLVQKDNMDDTEIAKMLSESVGPVIKTKGDPSTSVSMLQPHIPPDLVQWVEQVRQDVRETMGFGRQQMGESPSGRRTATEMQIVQSAKELRMDERRDMVADAVIDIMRKVNQVIFDRWDTQHVVQVVGIDGARYWVNYSKEAIIGEYNVKVDVESMTPTTKAMKKREIIELIGALGKYPGANMDYLMKMLLREFEYVDVMNLLPQAPETNSQQPMGMDQYVSQQQGLANNPTELQGRLAQTQNAVGSVL